MGIEGCIFMGLRVYTATESYKSAITWRIGFITTSFFFCPEEMAAMRSSSCFYILQVLIRQQQQIEIYLFNRNM